MKATRLFNLFVICFVMVCLLGCDAFVRKFTRKPNKDQLPQEELVLAPEEYKPTMSKEELYRQYLLYWQSWQDELIESLGRRSNYKKQVSCVEQAIKNLEQVKLMLNEEKRKKLDIYFNQLKALKGSITEDSYGLNIPIFRQNAERLRRGILRDFSYSKVKGFLL